MMFQMLDVIFHYKFQREFSRVFDCYLIRQKLVIDVFDNVGKMQIICLPQID